MTFYFTVIVQTTAERHLIEMEFNNPSTRSEPIIAKRSMDVESHSRCFCIWNCRCHCIQKVETLNDINVCHRMGYLAERDAGLLLNCPSSIDSEDVYPIDINNDSCPSNPPDFNRIFGIIFIIILVIILLGKHLIQFNLFLISVLRPKISYVFGLTKEVQFLLLIQ